jgi:hypothetical protein
MPHSSYSYEQQKAILDALNSTFAALPQQQETLQKSASSNMIIFVKGIKHAVH